VANPTSEIKFNHNAIVIGVFVLSSIFFAILVHFDMLILRSDQSYIFQLFAFSAIFSGTLSSFLFRPNKKDGSLSTFWMRHSFYLTLALSFIVLLIAGANYEMSMLISSILYGLITLLILKINLIFK
jgi:hypothetical protein